MSDAFRQEKHWWEEPKKITLNNGKVVEVSSISSALLKILTNKTEELGHKITFSEAAEIPDMVHPNEYAAHFVSFGDVAESVWRQVSRSDRKPHVKEEDAEKRADKEESIMRTKVDEASFVSKNRGRNRSYTKDGIIEKLRVFYNHNGRLPNQDDTRSGDFSPSWPTVVNYLGSRSVWMKYITEDNQETTNNSESEEINASVSSSAEKPTRVSSNYDAEILDKKMHVRTKDQETKLGEIRGLELKIILKDRDPILINITL